MVKVNDIKSKISKFKPVKVWGTQPLKPNSKFIFYLIIGFCLLNILLFYSAGKEAFLNFTNTARQGLNYFSQAKENVKGTNFEETKLAFKEAEKLFTDLQKDSWFLTSNLETPKALLNSATLVAESGQVLVDTAISLQELPNKLIELNADFEKDTSKVSSNNLKTLSQALVNIQKVVANLNQVTENLNSLNLQIFSSSLKKDIQEAKVQIQDLTSTLENLITYLQVASDLLGQDLPHTYLILLQNNFEQRPAGGFLGTLVFAEVNQGVLTKFDLADVYDYDGQLTNNPKYLPPEYKGFNKLLWIRDANYTPDFAISAKRIETLLQRANAPSVDTIISIDQTFIQNLLTLTGPISMEGFDAKISAENYFTVLTYLVEAHKEENAQDKKVLAEFLTSFEQQLFQNLDFKTLLPLVTANLKTKHLQLFSKKSFIQEQIENFNLANYFLKPSSNQDFLAITNSSIGGNKTDRYLKQRYIHNTHFDANGKIQDTLTIRKFHSFTDREELVWQSQLRPFGVTEMVDYTRYILGRGDNVSMVKVYVPNSSKLVKIEGLAAGEKVQKFKDPDLKQDYFLFKMSVKPGQTKEITLVYEPDLKYTPKPITDYNLVLVSQAGAPSIPFEKTYSFDNPELQKIYAHYPPVTDLTEQGIPSSQFNLDSNIQVKAVYAKY